MLTSLFPILFHGARALAGRLEMSWADGLEPTAGFAAAFSPLDSLGGGELGASVYCRAEVLTGALQRASPVWQGRNVLYQVQFKQMNELIGFLGGCEGDAKGCDLPTATCTHNGKLKAPTGRSG